MARSSQAAIGHNGGGDANESAAMHKLRADLRKYKDRCKALTRQLDTLREAAPDADAGHNGNDGNARKASDASSSDTSARNRFDESLFRPETFLDNFLSTLNFVQISIQKQQIKIFPSITGNYKNNGFQGILKPQTVKIAGII
jgi:hypothetical protein